MNKGPYQCIFNVSFLRVNKTTRRIHKEKPKEANSQVMPPPLKAKDRLISILLRKGHAVVLLSWHNGKEEKENGLIVHFPRGLFWHWTK